ncbi:hypothetical protein AM1BK_27680 [Neobacillus kokaensis]|uniref:Uncharacterized protein n=1 Tax=Neobacillus kokaensis TaxID=2759023 RepID=A0ABQ3N5V1_9BACI|nr:hypothetical protein AM1BK_27680 [Neobacillus kokaensis]
MGRNLSGKRTTIGRISGESHVPPKELYSQVKGQRKVGTAYFSLSFFCLRKIGNNSKGGTASITMFKP